jgi:prophage maintenance system killer protein
MRRSPHRLQNTIQLSRNLPRNSEATYRLSAAFIERAHDVGINVIWPGIEPVKRGNCLDINLLLSAAQQPYQDCFGGELYPGLAAKAGYIFYHLASGHVFGNGNKRTAALCLDTFLLANSQYLTLSNEEVHDLAQAVASDGERGVRFDDELPRITALIGQNMIPISTFRQIDMRIYRGLHKSKNSIRKAVINHPEYPLTQRVVD